MLRMTLEGMYRYEPSLFDDMVLPDGLDKSLLINEMIAEFGDLYTYYQVPEKVKINITAWSRRKLFDYTQMYRAMRADYNPTENYDKNDNLERTYTDSGEDTNSSVLGSKSESNSSGGGNNLYEVSAYNEEDFANRDKNTATTHDHLKTETSGGDTHKTKYGKVRKEVEVNRIHGNIGVTTTQHLIEEEINLRLNYNLYAIISADFERQFMVQVY